MSGLGLGALVTEVVALAKDLVGGDDGVLVDVTHKPWLRQDGFGAVTYGTTVTRQAMVEDYVRTYRRADGTEQESRHKLSFLEHVPVGLKDALILPDGTTGPILDISGLFSQAQQRFVTIVALGSSLR